MQGIDGEHPAAEGQRPPVLAAAGRGPHEPDTGPHDEGAQALAS
jgi:hypothetical protein